MKSANSGAPTPTKNGGNTKSSEEKYSQRLNQSQNTNGKGILRSNQNEQERIVFLTNFYGT